MTEIYKCPNCGESVYTHATYEDDHSSWYAVTRIYVCEDKLIWHMLDNPPTIFYSTSEVANLRWEIQDLQEELGKLQNKYNNLLLSTTGFLDSLIDPVEKFVSLIVTDFEEGGFYEEDEDPAYINQQFLQGLKGVTAKEEEVDVLLPREES